METEDDDNGLDNWKLPDGNYIVKKEKDEELNGDIDIKFTLPSHLGAFILRILNEL